jgi:hypothetical protein
VGDQARRPHYNAGARSPVGRQSIRLRTLSSEPRALQTQVSALGTALQRLRAFVDRINLIEEEYVLAMHQTELQWGARIVRRSAA